MQKFLSTKHTMLYMYFADRLLPALFKIACMCEKTWEAGIEH